MEYQRLIDNQDDRGIHFVYFRSHYSFVAKYRDDITLAYHDNSWSDTYPIFVNIYFRDISKTQEL